MQAWKARFYFYLVGAKSVKNEEENKQKKSLSPNPSPRRNEDSKASPSAPLRRERGVVSHENGGGHFGIN